MPLHDPCFIGGSNLTATKARLLLMACLMKFGSLPPAADPDHPTSAEAAAIGERSPYIKRSSTAIELPAAARRPAYLGRVQGGNNSSGSLTHTNGMPC